MLKQKTLRGSFSLNGKGLHTGVNLTVKPTFRLLKIFINLLLYKLQKEM